MSDPQTTPTKLRARKRFGQHFLVDQHVTDKIITAIAPQTGDNMVEIGPGGGVLTRPLLEHAGELHVIEVDRDLAAQLRAMDTGQFRLHVHEFDILKVSLGNLLQSTEQIRLAGNLPYNISTPLIFHLLEEIGLIRDMVFMLQKEVADRILAGPGSRQYGRLSVMLQYFCEAQCLFDVPPEAFSPRPRVMSSIIRLVPHRKRLALDDLSFFQRLVKQAFSQRRKTLRNSLRGLAGEAELESVGLVPSVRAETVELQKFVALANYIAGSRG